MLSQNVTPLTQLKEQANLQYFKKLLSNKYLQETALVFTASSKSHEEIESDGEKKQCLIIFKYVTDHSLNSLRHKQLIQKVTTAKSFVKPETLPPTTESALRYHSFQRYFQITQQERSKLLATEQRSAVKSGNFFPVLTDLEVTTQYILKIIRCPRKIESSSDRCGS